MKRAQWIPVVTALIQSKGKVLVGQRPDDDTLPGLWEFPGGKIELGESPTAALARELKEELNIDAEIGPLKIATTHQYSATGLLILFFSVNFWKGELKPLHHQEIQWIEPRELKNLKLPEANLRVLPTILDALVENG